MRISDWSSDVCSSDLKCDALRVEYLDMVEQLLRQRFVDPRRRLIEQYQARLHHQHPPQGQQFALSAGQVPGHFVGEVIQAQERQDFMSLVRSEEHTSALQSLMPISYAVFCLNNKKPK